MANKVQSPAKLYVGLHFCILLFSFSGVFSKLASRFPTLSWGFLLCYGASLFVLFYAILWHAVPETDCPLSIPPTQSDSDDGLSMSGRALLSEAITLT